MSTLIWVAAIAGLLIGLFGLFLCAIAGRSDRRAPRPPYGCGYPVCIERGYCVGHRPGGGV